MDDDDDGDAGLISMAVYDHDDGYISESQSGIIHESKVLD
jgi:hypothetical protein